MKFQVWSSVLVGGDLFTPGEFFALPERTLLVEDDVDTVDGVEMVGSWETGHGWDPNGTVAQLTGKPMQRPRGWPPREPLATFQARFERYGLDYEFVTA